MLWEGNRMVDIVINKSYHTSIWHMHVFDPVLLGCTTA